MGSEGWSEIPTAKADRPNLARRDPVNHDGAGIHVGGALLAFSASSVSLARSVCAKLSAASLDSKLTTVSWSSMVTVTA
jgi:hypothetical protein